MVLLKLTLVILILEIGERTMCSDPCKMEAESSPFKLPQSSLLDAPDEEGCKYQLLFVEAEGPLVVNCTKDCPNGEKKTVTEGEACIVTVKKAADPDDVIVLVGSCDKEGSCVTKGDSDCRTITLPGPDSDEGEDEEEGEEEEEEEKGKKKEE
uniref:Evasin n=1 Tax=Ixodes ricinus TaxID=34613 RepID=A0A090XD02_IXORI